MDYNNLDIDQIITDPNQPRKFFDPEALAELTESIKAAGVIQPILVRPVADKYMLVCGERRYRASIAASLSKIPAVVKNISDEQALELQIVENLQRRDVHPMEEAVAFSSLISANKFSVNEISERVGKSDFYVRQRVKLCDLTPDWQSAFFANRIQFKHAIQICQLPNNIQSTLFNDRAGNSTINIDSNVLALYRGALNTATFNINDPDLIPTIGPCTSCRYNTSVSLLFPEHADSARCLNIGCYKEKSDLYLQLQVDKAKENPSILFVNHSYHEGNDMINKLKSEGFAVYTRFKDYDIVDEPIKPDLEDLKNEYEYEIENGEKTLSDINHEFEVLSQIAADEYREYLDMISGGTYKKALVICSNNSIDAGTYIYVKLKSKKRKEDSGLDSEPSVDGIENEIDRLKDRELRNKELDAEKEHSVIKMLLKDSTQFNSCVGELTPAENSACIIALWKVGSYEFRKQIYNKFIKNKGNSDDIIYGCPPILYSKLQVSTTDLALVVRWFIASSLIANGGSRLKGGDDLAVHHLALYYHPEEVATVLDNQAEAASRRLERLKTRIAALEDDKKQLLREKHDSKRLVSNN